MLLGFAALAETSEAASDSRVLRETKALLTVVSAKLPQLGSEIGFTICELPTEFEMTFEYEKSRAQGLLGSRRGVDASGEGAPISVRDVLKISRDQEAAFCDQAAHERYGKAEYERFESDPEISRLAICRSSFSLPLFANNFRRAVVLIGHATASYDRDGGRIGRHPLGASRSIFVYRKIGGRWRYWKSELVGET